MFPDEGKYHLDGHRKCDVRLEPAESRKLNDICPECGKPLTVGVLEKIIAQERPDGLLPTLGGQTGLNLAVELADGGLDLLPRNREAAHRPEPEPEANLVLIDLDVRPLLTGAEGSEERSPARVAADRVAVAHSRTK